MTSQTSQATGPARRTGPNQATARKRETVAIVPKSRYRAVIQPVVAYVESLHAQRPELTLTVIVPDLAVRHWWQRPLHDDTAVRLRHALAPLSKVVVTSVPFHI